MSWLLTVLKAIAEIFGFGSGVVRLVHDEEQRKSGCDEVTAATETIIA